MSSQLNPNMRVCGRCGPDATSKPDTDLFMAQLEQAIRTVKQNGDPLPCKRMHVHRAWKHWAADRAASKYVLDMECCRYRFVLVWIANVRGGE